MAKLIYEIIEEAGKKKSKAEKIESKNKDELSIKVIKSKGIKCPRCWKILEKNCDRCEKATNV